LEAEAAPVRKHRRALPEFLNVPWAMGEAAVVAAAFMAVVPLVLALALVGLSLVVPAVGQFTKQLADGAVGPSFVMDLAISAGAFGVVWAYLRRYKVGWQVVGWRRPVNLWKTLVYLVALLIGFVVVSALLLAGLGMLVHGFNPNQAQTNDFTTGAAQHLSISIIALVLVPPVLEETVFRGFIFPAIAKRTGLVWGAVISSVIFGLAHWQANISVYTFVLGLVLCFMYVKLKSTVPGMVLHMLNNLLAFAALSQK